MTIKLLFPCIAASLCSAGTAFSASAEREVMSERRAHSEATSALSTTKRQAPVEAGFAKEEASAKRMPSLVDRKKD